MNLRILHINGTIEDGNVDLSQTSSQPPNCRLRFQSSQRNPLVFDNDDFFECLVDLRRIIEAEGGRVLCNGARTDVFPSPMGRRTAGGLQAYQQQMGQKALSDDIVDIFAETPKELIGTIEEQRAYNEQWLVSLGWRKSGDMWFRTDSSKLPGAGEIEEARRFPNGSVSRILANYGEQDNVPLEAIEGFWEVDGNGKIVGSFLCNPKFDPNLANKNNG